MDAAMENEFRSLIREAERLVQLNESTHHVIVVKTARIMYIILPIMFFPAILRAKTTKKFMQNSNRMMKNLFRRCCITTMQRR